MPAETPQAQQQKPETSGPTSQQSYDRSFFEQISGSVAASPSALGWDVTSQVVQSYFEQIEAQTRQARRMADLWAQSLILQQTTSEIARVVAPAVYKQVLDHFRTNPEMLKDLISR